MNIDLLKNIGKKIDKFKSFYLLSYDIDTDTNTNIDNNNNNVSEDKTKDLNNTENNIINFINYKKILKTINDSIKPSFNYQNKQNKNNKNYNNYNNSNNNNNHNNYNNYKKENSNSQYSKYSNKTNYKNTNNNFDFNNVKRGSQERFEEDTKIHKWKDNGGSVLKKRLNGKNKQLLEINGEINKLTESNIDIIFDKINVIVIDKNTTKIPDDKLKYIFDNIINKCINQPTFTCLYIKFLNKFNKNINSKVFIKNEIINIIENIVGFIELIEIHVSKMDEKNIETKKNSNIFNSLIKENKKYEGLGTIYSLFYINKFVNCNMFVDFLKKTIQQVSDYIEWEPCTNEVLEKYINVLIGLLEFGYHKMIKDIDYETKLTLQMKIENVLSSKKIEMRIKYNLQNLYDDLKAGKRKMDI